MINADFTLNRVIAELKTWSDAHGMNLTFFGYGKFLQLQMEVERNYPAFVVNVTAAPSEVWYINYNFEIMVLDWVSDNEPNRTRIMSDTRQILNDLEETMRYSNRWQEFSKINGQINCVPANQKGLDKAFGWISSFTLKVKKRHGICDLYTLLPTYDFDSGLVVIPTCPPATYKNSNDTFIEVIASGQSFISADITNQINGVDQVAVPSNVPFNYSFECPIIPCAAASYEVEYENGTPISSGTIPSGGSAIISVPNVIVCPSELIYQEARYTGQVVSYGDGDPTWRKDNNKLLALVQPSNGICQRLQSGSNYLLFYDNVFGNKYMITGLTGGYYNPLDGNYYNVTNTIVTRGDVFPTEIGVDHLYNRLVQTLQDGTQKAWLTWLSDGLTLTISGFAEWYLPTINEGLSYADWSNTLPFQNSVPFSWNTAAKLLGDTYLGSGTNQCYTMESYGHIRSIIKNNSNKAIYIKPIDINSIFG